MIFDAALSGLKAATSNLDVIGNNIANSSTVGFKGSRADFGDIYSFGGYGSFGAGGTSIGSGVMLTKVQQSFASGNLSSSTNSLDLAVNGSGFFILNNPGGGQFTHEQGSLIWIIKIILPMSMDNTLLVYLQMAKEILRELQETYRLIPRILAPRQALLLKRA